VHKSLILLLSSIALSIEVPIKSDAQWIQTSGPNGGMTWCFGVSRHEEILAGTGGGGVYSSVDSGKTWTVLFQVPSTSDVKAIAADHSGNIIFATRTGEIYRSSNDGLKWTAIGTEDTKFSVAASTPSGVFFLGGMSSGTGVLYRSTDHGASWLPVGPVSPGIDLVVNSILASGTGDVVIGTVSGAYRSTNNGETWDTLSLDIHAGVYSFAIDSSGILCAATGTGIVRSLDSGKTWEQALTPNLVYSAISLTATPNGEFFAGLGGGDLAGGIWRSTDHGHTWTATTLSAGTIWALISPGINMILSNRVNGEGMLRSIDNGDSWNESSIGMHNSDISRLLVDRHQNLIAGGSSIFISTDKGGSWKELMQCAQTYDLGVDSAGYIFAATEDGFYRLAPDGSSDQRIDSSSTISYIRNVLVTRNGSIYALSGNDSLYRSDNGGKTWTSGLMVPSTATGSLCESPWGSIYLGSDSAGIERSTDLGHTWHNSQGFSPSVNAIAVGPATPMYASTVNQGVFYSLDSGITWKAGGLNGILVNALALNSSGNLYAATEAQGIYVSIDSARSWRQINNGLLNYSIADIAFDSAGYGFIGTIGGGVYVTEFSTTSVKTANNGIIRGYRLDQNYPNPFNPTTVIDYQLPAMSIVSLKVYDMLGREVQTLVNGRQEAGLHSVTFNPRFLASGLYFYRLKAGSYSETKKLVVLR